MYKYFDPATGRMKSPYEVYLDDEKRFNDKLEATSKIPAFKVPNGMVDDWTGQ